MSNLNPQVEEKLRQAFKQLNRFMLLLWRLGLGAWINAWPEVGGRILVITHTGRVTGFRRRTPVNFAIVGGEIYCAAGFGSISDWYRNILANPQVEVWLPDGWWQAVVEDVSDHPLRLHLMRQVLIGSGFAARIFGLNPHTLSDPDLAAVSENYRLLHIRRCAPRTGPDGPGDLAWVWPLSTFILLPLALRRRRRRRLFI